MHKGSVYLLLSILLLGLDWITKKWAVLFLTFGHQKEIFYGFNLTLTHNYGMAFGILNNGQAWSRWLLTILASLISLILIRLILKSDNKSNSLGLSLILGGAIGNVVDRLQYGYVIDFIQIYIDKYYWPAFNIADAGISVGAIIIAIQLIWGEEAKQSSSTTGTPNKTI